MLESRVPQDIRKFKTKAVGPFSLRQVICVLVALVLDLIVYAALIKPLGLSLNAIIYICIFIDLPACAFSFEAQGLPMEQFISTVLIRYLMTPAKRYPSCVIQEIKKPALSDKELNARKKAVKRLERENPDIKAY